MTSGKCLMGLKKFMNTVFSAPLDERSLNPQCTRAKNENLRQKWLELSRVHSPLMDTLWQHEDFTDADIDSVHVQSNRLMDACARLLTGDNVTDCIHIIGSGHLCCHLTKCRNLHRCSQQGWEAMHQKPKHFHFNNANHGGCCGNKNGAVVSGDHCRPLMRMCQWFMMWKLGIGDAFFMSWGIALDAIDSIVEEDGIEHGEI